MNFFVSDGLIVSILLLNNLLGDIPNRPSSFKLLSSGNARIAFAVSHFAMLRDYQLWSTFYIAHAAEYKPRVPLLSVEYIVQHCVKVNGGKKLHYDACFVVAFACGFLDLREVLDCHHAWIEIFIEHVVL